MLECGLMQQDRFASSIPLHVLDIIRMANAFPDPPAQIHTLPDARKIAYRIFGAGSEEQSNGSSRAYLSTIFYFHGSLSSSLEAALWHTAAIFMSIRLVAVDRPGIGESTFSPSGTLLSFADDLQELAAHLRIARFGLIGVSGGGPFVLACLHAIPPEKITTVSVVSGLYPASLGLAGMALAGRALLWITPWMTGLVAAGLDFGIGRLARDVEHPERLDKLIERDLATRTDADRMVLSGQGKKDACVRAFREGLKQGAQGAAWDLRLMGWDWGFGLEQLNGRKLVLWHGSEDSNCPIRMTRAAAEQINGAELVVKEGDAHLSMTFGYTEEVLRQMVT